MSGAGRGNPLLSSWPGRRLRAEVPAFPITRERDSRENLYRPQPTLNLLDGKVYVRPQRGSHDPAKCRDVLEKSFRRMRNGLVRRHPK